jgi:phosphatidate cytidylyltransferase
MFKHRIISFPLLLLLAFLVVVWQHGYWIFAVLLLPAAVAAVLELRTMAKAMKIPVCAAAAAAASVLMLLKYGFGGLFVNFRSHLPNAVTVITLLFCLLMLMLLFDRDRERAVKSLFGTAGTFLTTMIVVLPLAKIYFEAGAMVFLMMVLCTKASDTGGYIVGMLSHKLMKNGNHKIVPSISPKKSWEGTIGAALFSIGTAFAFAACGVLIMPWYAVTVFGFAAFLGSFAGDLTESQLKRTAGIKDSGSWIPGMGGIWDVIDSFIYNAPLFYLAFESGVLQCQ